MGFEQLAELKKQLAAARAEAAPAAKRGAKPAASKPAAKPASKTGSKSGARPARQPAQPRGDTPAPHAHAKPAADARPVDPVVKSIGRLQKRFPVAFPKNPAPKLPLKVGIFEDLIAHAKDLSLSEAELRDAIKTWCRGSRYWKCLVEGAARVDLTGAEAGKVTAQEAAGAQRLQAHRAARSAPKAPAAAAQAPAAETAKTAQAAAETAAEIALTPVDAATSSQPDADGKPQASSTEPSVQTAEVAAPANSPAAPAAPDA
ncbi:Activator of osmoprotectant transporter ProP [Paraburkholderia ribeironis]|uniref:Activator of osmoprotectant transporter ProP n=1 Tax=Paraburkholderia ribeironis TaxID=1247936 RepID=A0A1N7RVV1_9BURK|nr:ProQ/FinO family protein [Paraburkholderia ribeironis]SIT39239.1 Activator of osmoprotectant transporter ProP [Paraburkholderia ribeironis]